MGFPRQVYRGAADYLGAYREEVARAWASLDAAAFDTAAALLGAAIEARRTVYVCGNGGSAAISGHLLCDVLKGVQPARRQPRRAARADHRDRQRHRL